MRIGTWNLDRCPSSTSEKGQEVAARLDELKADLWLLTEVHRDWDPRGGTFAVSRPRSFDPDAPKRWAGVETSLPLTTLPSQGEHPGEEGLVLARVQVDGRDVLVACSVLPWRGAEQYWYGLPEGQIAQFHSVLQHHVERIRTERREDEPLVWGGDFNQALRRPVYGGTVEGMTALQSAFASLGLVALTVDAEHRNGHMRSIDHLAVSEHFTAASAETHRLTRSDGSNLSDHAAYTADVELTGPATGSGPTAVATRDEPSGWTSWAGVPGFLRKGEQQPPADVDDLDEQSVVARAGQELVERLLRTGIDGFGPFKPAAESAREALEGRTPEQAVSALVRNHCALAGAQGFVTNVGGLVTLPVALPANVGASYLVQAHLAASIAAVHGHDLNGEQMRSAVLLCLLGNAGTEVLKRAGVTVGTKMSTALIKRIPVTVIREINKRAGFALVAKFGTKRAALTLAKGVPVVGGVIGGGFDVVATRAVGAFADRTFRPGVPDDVPVS
ncbi:MULTISPECIES: endonuclease/exonuclease/phosphatase family protein [unclassified Geodermatophilus]